MRGRGRSRGRAALALLVALGLAGGPVARVVTTRVCDRCPPTCPMHAKGRLGCHARQATHGGCHRQGAGLSAPGCCRGHERPALASQQAVLPVPVRASRVPVRAALYPMPTTPGPDRAEPPETPPPISLA